MLDQLSVLKLVTGRLDTSRIAYMVNGSIAAEHYGQSRMTREIDVVVQFAGLVDGPLVIGAGRYLGSELCRPVSHHGE